MMSRVLGVSAQIAPWAVVGGLAYAAAFIKPGIEPLPLPQPLNESRDLFYDVSVSETGKYWFAGSNGLVLEAGLSIEDWRRHDMPKEVNLRALLLMITALCWQSEMRDGRSVITATASGNLFSCQFRTSQESLLKWPGLKTISG